MARILVINPNSSQACGRGIEEAVSSFPGIEVVNLPDGPPAIYSWRDWHLAAEQICRRIEADEARDPPDAYVIACASDPGIEAARALTARPVFGVLRCAVAAAVARAERFGIIAIVDASRARHMAALRAMGLESRLAGSVALNVTMDTLLDANAARTRLIAAAKELGSMGAQTIILGCTGMAHHRPAIEHACGLPVIDPCQAGAALAVGAVVG